MIGHKQVLLLSTAITGAGLVRAGVPPTFSLFLVAWALQGFYVVWLPLEIGIVAPPFGRHRGPRA